MTFKEFLSILSGAIVGSSLVFACAILGLELGQSYVEHKREVALQEQKERHAKELEDVRARYGPDICELWLSHAYRNQYAPLYSDLHIGTCS